ncbi:MULTISPECIES: potassium transporter Kup [Rhizobium]|uniref:Probable potassium transport system protein Kup n=1 Tax=Rhizobium phaseoli TaxID=396 RepID=A0A7X6F7E2_9HYPH|nr:MULTISPECIES: potassium transporter Kup [Rhizobium]ANL38242.1 potassium transporter protein Kup 4 [Rhizobium phaseoli]ANL44655.1 potassium transporter protein Kup 3 [Rhizobium phaseoli]ANL63619.1 potassium transporter protein Kup 3 [Rhizobium phaseoli]ANM01945.1 potassium transporter protein Kup 4 [Rhizobium phaseoli]MDE8763139.1 potassium transporter Kup [Rhizobium sp. CBK13]
MTYPQLRLQDPEIEHKTGGGLPGLVLAALGVVYGDIGTSPLYAFREALHATMGSGSHRENVLGILSLIVWALTIVVTIKYVSFVLKADNRGEGGTLSLMTLARESLSSRPAWVLVLGVAGASLFLGDAIITPAISVLSAVEGIQVVAPALSGWIVPITLAIIAVLFFVQRFGTGGVASVFGPVMALWFVVLGVSGTVHIIDDPDVLWAVNPLHALRYAASNVGTTITVLGAVFLAVTGAEALYVDLGHFGRRPIVTAWFVLVFPCLLLNYFGQGAFVLANPEMAAHPFFGMHPDWAKIPIVCLATAATVIASQAVISGAYSLVRQAMHLNLLPRLQILHTSETHSGQIFMPQVNSLLFIFVVALVLQFRNSSGLSAAYGIAVTGEMLITSVLLYVVMRRIWNWKTIIATAVVLPLVIIDAGFLAANVAKFADGGWVPVAVACTMGLIMQTWMSGRRLLAARTKMDEIPLAAIIDKLAQKQPPTVPGTAIFLTSDIEGAPTALLHSLKHYKVLHEHNVILSVVTAATPFVPDDEKIFLESFNPRFSRLIITFGYMETPNIPRALVLVRKLGLKFDIMSTSFFLSRRTILPSKRRGMPFWQDRLFIALAQNAGNATDYFGLPTGRVVELGLQTTI